jgi:ammonia channel protein AmtB
MASEGEPGSQAQGAKTVAGTVPRLYQQVFEIVAGQIVQGVLAEGTRLSESGLAEQVRHKPRTRPARRFANWNGRACC